MAGIARDAPDGFRELAALVMADVAGRRADEPRDRVLLLVLGHVDAHHHLLVVEQELRQRLAQLRLAHARRALQRWGRIGSDIEGVLGSAVIRVHRTLMGDRRAVGGFMGQER